MRRVKRSGLRFGASCLGVLQPPASLLGCCSGFRVERSVMGLGCWDLGLNLRG
jgi:hypothetical protein